MDAVISEVKITEREPDPVNSPEHYNAGKIETIDYIVDVLGEFVEQVMNKLQGCLRGLTGIKASVPPQPSSLKTHR